MPEFKTIKLPLNRILRALDDASMCRFPSVVVIEQEPSETWSEHQHLVIPTDQEVEVVIDETLAGRLNLLQ